MDVDRKSRLLSTCFHSIFTLPQLDVLEKHSCLLLEPPNIQVQRALKPTGLWQDIRISLMCGWKESQGWPLHRLGGGPGELPKGSGSPFVCLGHGP